MSAADLSLQSDRSEHRTLSIHCIVRLFQGCQLVVVNWIDSYSRHAVLWLTAIILIQVCLLNLVLL